MRRGEVVETGTVDESIPRRRPITRKMLLKAVPRIDGERQRGLAAPDRGRADPEG
jgi:ABC-type dipeptide/oligopeptide/nickel transport system ATPase component